MDDGTTHTRNGPGHEAGRDCGQETHSGHEGAGRRLLRRLGRVKLRYQLLALVVAFIFFAEVVFLLPSVSMYRKYWLIERLNAAYVASLVFEAMPNHVVPEGVRQALLTRAGALAISRKEADQRTLVQAAALPSPPVAYYDLDQTRLLGLVGQGLEALFAPDGRIIRVSGMPEMRYSAHEGSVPVIDIVISESPLRQSMFAYIRRMLGLSLGMSLLTALFLYATLNSFLVRRIRRLSESMLRFRDNPEDAGRVIRPSGRGDEIGEAEEALYAMQADLRAALHQKSRLAALGTAVSKINHDLRNILAAAQLFSDRMSMSQDPVVQRQAPKLMRALDRAVQLTTQTLRFGRAEEPPPVPRPFKLAELADEVIAALPVTASRVENRVDVDLALEADPDQVYRILFNLARNAVEALDAEGREGNVGISARREAAGGVAIEISDDGPGIPLRLQGHLFKPFASRRGGEGARDGGTGLGLAISRELARAHGGDLLLVKSDLNGTLFRIVLPDRAHFH